MEESLSGPEKPPSPEPSLSGLRFSRGRLLWMGILAVATISALLVLGDAPTTLGAIQKADWGYIGLAVLIHYSSFAVRGHRWQLLLRSAGYRLAYARVTSILIGGWFVSALLPARLGEVFRIAVLKLPPRQSQQAVPVADSLSSIILERALDITALLVLGATFGYLAFGPALPSWVTTLYLIALALLILLVIALLVAPGALDWLRKLSDGRWWIAAMRFAQQTIASLRTLHRHPAIAVTIMVESLYIWLCDALVLWFVLIAVGVPVSFANAGFVSLTVDISAAIPLTPGGMGQIEVAYSALLAMLSIAPAGISAAVLLVRLITYWSFLVFSAIITFASGLGRIIFSRKASAAMSTSETISDAESS